MVLEIDHIHPVSKDGENDILNLITSCFDCNRGKGDRLISDDSVIKKQHEQLKVLQERKEQLEMMLEWRKGLDDIKQDYIDAFEDVFFRKTGHHLAPPQMDVVKKWLKTFSLNQLLDGLDVSVDYYYAESEHRFYDACKAFDKISGICHNKACDKGSKTKYYINYTLKAIKGNGWFCKDAIVRDFISANVRNDEDFELVKKCLRNARNWSNFRKLMGAEFLTPM